MASVLVWTEKETGDWEACVAASYLMGLVYGGVSAFPLGIYTQAEREALELVPDEPQDYATTDSKAQARYGVALRKLSTGSIADAVTRTGVGLVCTGYGGLLIPTNASIHSLFYLPTSPTGGLVYDPLANNRSAGVPIAASQVVTWTAGRAGPNQVREVRADEFAPIGEPDVDPTYVPIWNRQAHLIAGTAHVYGAPKGTSPLAWTVPTPAYPIPISGRCKGDTINGTNDWLVYWSHSALRWQYFHEGDGSTGLSPVEFTIDPSFSAIHNRASVLVPGTVHVDRADGMGQPVWTVPAAGGTIPILGRLKGAALGTPPTDDWLTYWQEGALRFQYFHEGDGSTELVPIESAPGDDTAWRTWLGARPKSPEELWLEEAPE